jgi:ribosomal protein S7
MQKIMNNIEKLKKKLLKHTLKNGKKLISEKALTKSFKSIQKSKKKPHNEILKLAILNSTPMFRIIKLKNKKRRKQSTKEIPAFLSTYQYRTSWGLKYLTKTSTLKTFNSFSSQLKHEILLTAKHDSNAVTLKKELQTKALEKKKYFKHYRW